MEKNWKVIDGTNLILGRLCSKVAKLTLMGEKIVIINSKRVQISGNKRQIVAHYIHYKNIKTRSNPRKGPFRVGIRPDIFIRKTIRGMLPMKKQRGKDAIARVHTYISSIPEAKKAQYGSIEKMELPASKFNFERLSHKSVQVAEVCKIIGWNQGKMTEGVD